MVRLDVEKGGDGDFCAGVADEASGFRRRGERGKTEHPDFTGDPSPFDFSPAPPSSLPIPLPAPAPLLLSLSTTPSIPSQPLLPLCSFLFPLSPRPFSRSFRLCLGWPPPSSSLPLPCLSLRPPSSCHLLSASAWPPTATATASPRSSLHWPSPTGAPHARTRARFSKNIHPIRSLLLENAPKRRSRAKHGTDQ